MRGIVCKKGLSAMRRLKARRGGGELAKLETEWVAVKDNWDGRGGI